MYEYTKPELASYTSSTGIVLDLKTKQECGRVYFIQSHNAPGLFSNPSCPVTLYDYWERTERCWLQDLRHGGEKNGCLSTTRGGGWGSTAGSCEGE